VLNRNAEVIGYLKRASEFGVEIADYSIDFSKIMGRKDAVVKRLTSGVSMLLKKAGVEVIKGTAAVDAPDRIVVTDSEGVTCALECDDLIIATGSETSVPPIKGIEKSVTSKEVLNLSELPKSMIIMGGGVIGIEFASIFKRFGVDVRVIEMLDQILPTIDVETAKDLERCMKKEGISFETSCRVEEIKEEDGQLTVSAGGKEYRAELVVAAFGRKAVLPPGKLDLQLDHGAIVTDEYMRTSIPHVYCIGDANGKAMLAHVASHEAIVAVDHIMGGNKKMSYRVIPSVVYSFPEVAAVGKTEKEAGRFLKGAFPYAGNGKALALGESAGSVRVLADEQYHEMIGASIIGYDAASLIGELAMAMQLESTVEEIADTIHAHPSLNEMIMEACEDVLGNAIHK